MRVTLQVHYSSKCLLAGLLNSDKNSKPTVGPLLVMRFLDLLANGIEDEKNARTHTACSCSTWSSSHTPENFLPVSPPLRALPFLRPDLKVFSPAPIPRPPCNPALLTTLVPSPGPPAQLVQASGPPPGTSALRPRCEEQYVPTARYLTAHPGPSILSPIAL
ncbi:hypothetical protein CCUS01_13337 [Colletotrichum cuscutae]|uniref:Uncharacterized protein n=1 Tax=Colletotrichum cuscutae TaxID=1209917 RepID=A0AAI9YBW6_9PEZI|nr:hypothetical protein CCUS01_13337 [Colletotrichum cuscutae]